MPDNLGVFFWGMGGIQTWAWDGSSWPMAREGSMRSRQWWWLFVRSFYVFDIADIWAGIAWRHSGLRGNNGTIYKSIHAFGLFRDGVSFSPDANESWLSTMKACAKLSEKCAYAKSRLPSKNENVFLVESQRSLGTTMPSQKVFEGRKFREVILASMDTLK